MGSGCSAMRARWRAPLRPRRPIGWRPEATTTTVMACVDGANTSRSGLHPTVDPERCRPGRIGLCIRTSLESPTSARSDRGGSKRVLFLPSVNLLEHGLPYEVPDPVEVIIAVDDTHEVIVVASLDPAGDGDLREDLLPRFR
jgi:hypothetical protein